MKLYVTPGSPYARMARIVAATDGLLVAVLLGAVLFGGRRMWPGGVHAQRLAAAEPGRIDVRRDRRRAEQHDPEILR